MKISALTDGNVVQAFFGENRNDTRATRLKNILRGLSYDQQVAAVEYYRGMFRALMEYWQTINRCSLCECLVIDGAKSAAIGNFGVLYQDFAKAC